jgi:hypothetical protein
VSVRSTAGFGGPALAGLAVGDGLRIWLIATAIGALLVGGVLLLHVAPQISAAVKKLRGR